MAPESDDPDLRARVEQLEATVEQQQATIQQLLPSRRRVLQAGGLLAGGGVLGALSADRASADVTGQVGTQQDRVDVFAGQVDANSVSTEKITNGLIFAGNYDGPDADARLDAALADISPGQHLLLESAEYSSPRTISQALSITGQYESLAAPDGTEISTTWTFEQRISLKKAYLVDSGGFVLNNDRITITHITDFGNGVTVEADEVLVTHQRFGSVEFGASTAGGLVDSSIGVSVSGNTTDNTVADIS